MLPRPFRHRGIGADPGQRAGAVPDEGQGAGPRGRWIVHPFLIATFPIVFLYSHNVYETSARALAIPIVVALAATLALWLALRWLSRDARRAGLATSLIVALFFAYHQTAIAVNLALERLSRLWVYRGFDVGPLVVLSLQALVAAPLCYLIFRRMKHPGTWTAFANAFAVILVALPVGNAVRARMNEPARPIIRSEGAIPIARKPARLPDIYYIILDAYARSDVMKELFDFDNGPFLAHLEQKGFYVARRSRSNYAMTALSLCSTLNCNYLDALIAPDARDKNPLGEMIRDNLVVKSLRPLGYKFVAFSTGYDMTECSGADRLLYPRHPANNFQMMLVRMTPLKHLPLDVKAWDYYESIRERVRFVLDTLPEIAEDPEPTFTFAHIISPHHPFVFGEDGTDVDPRPRKLGNFGQGIHVSSATPEHYREGYRKQAIFLTRRIERVIDQILARSPEPPIIILQSDHGSGLRHHLNDIEETDLHERMSILNCFYFPDRNYEGLTQTMTPVNTFRVVLNHTFGTGLPMLENRNYFSTLRDSFSLTDVTDRLDSDRDRDRKFRSPDFYPGLVQ